MAPCNTYNLELHLNIDSTGDIKGNNNNLNKPCSNKYCVPKCGEKVHTYEEALDKAGNGIYNVTLLAVLSIVFISMVIDIFGFAVIITGCSCEFQLSIQHKSILTSMPFIGSIFMSYVWGYNSDTRGRKACLLTGMFFSFIFSAASSMSPHWIVLAVLKFLSTSFSSSAQTATLALLGESCSQRVRSSYMLLITSASSLAHVTFYLSGYAILPLDFSYDMGLFGSFTPWRLLTFVLSLPLGFSALSLLFFHESPKFLLHCGREDEALDVLKSIHKRNNGESDSYHVQKITLNEPISPVNSKTSLLQSMWVQTKPLFKAPLLKNTLILYYLMVILYGTGSSFSMWFPIISDSFFSALKDSSTEINGLCDLVVKGSGNAVINSNITIDSQSFHAPVCTSQLETNSVLVGVTSAVIYGFVNLGASTLAFWRKALIIFSISLHAFAGIGTVLSPEPISAMVLFIVFYTTNLGVGLASSYLVDLYPTSHRGMVACLGMVVARFSGLAGSNVVGGFVMTHCRSTFYMWSVFVLSGALVAFFLPPDRTAKKV